MGKNNPLARFIYAAPAADVEGFDSLAELALDDGKEHGDDPSWDAVEANQLYELLERHVVPEFYARDLNGIPTAWIARVRESMSRLTP